MDKETDADTDTWFIVKATDPYPKGHRPIPKRPPTHTHILDTFESIYRDPGTPQQMEETGEQLVRTAPHNSTAS